MKIDWTKIIQTALYLCFGIYAVSELRPTVSKEFQPVTIDATVQEQTNKRINYLDSLLLEKDKIISKLQSKRNGIPKEVALYSDSDVTAFNDSIVAVYHLK